MHSHTTRKDPVKTLDISSVVMNKQTHLHLGWPEVEVSFFGSTIYIKTCTNPKE